MRQQISNPQYRTAAWRWQGRDGMHRACAAAGDGGSGGGWEEWVYQAMSTFFSLFLWGFNYFASRAGDNRVYRPKSKFNPAILPIILFTSKAPEITFVHHLCSSSESLELSLEYQTKSPVISRSMMEYTLRNVLMLSDKKPDRLCRLGRGPAKYHIPSCVSVRTDGKSPAFEGYARRAWGTYSRGGKSQSRLRNRNLCAHYQCALSETRRSLITDSSMLGIDAHPRNKARLAFDHRETRRGCVVRHMKYLISNVGESSKEAHLGLKAKRQSVYEAGRERRVEIVTLPAAHFIHDLRPRCAEKRNIVLLARFEKSPRLIHLAQCRIAISLGQYYRIFPHQTLKYGRLPMITIL